MNLSTFGQFLSRFLPIEADRACDPDVSNCKPDRLLVARPEIRARGLFGTGGSKLKNGSETYLGQRMVASVFWPAQRCNLNPVLIRPWNCSLHGQPSWAKHNTCV